MNTLFFCNKNIENTESKRLASIVAVINISPLLCQERFLCG